MESWDLVPRPIYASLGLNGFRSCLCHKGCWSRSQAYCLETLNIARIWLSKTSVIQQVFSLLFLQVGNNQNRLKNARNLKKLWLRSGGKQKKISVKCTNFEVASLNLEVQVWSLGFFDDVSVSKFEQGYSLNYITDDLTK